MNRFRIDWEKKTAGNANDPLYAIPNVANSTFIYYNIDAFAEFCALSQETSKWYAPAGLKFTDKPTERWAWVQSVKTSDVQTSLTLNIPIIIMVVYKYIGFSAVA